MNSFDRFHSLVRASFGRIRQIGGSALVAILAMNAPNVLAAADPAASVQFTSGHVTATAANTTRSLAKGDGIFAGDRVDTAENGRVQMRFTDGGLVSLMPNTTFSVDAYLHGDDADEANNLVFGMLKGGLRTVTGAIGKVKHDQYELKTPVATLGIRGTEYVAVLRPANTLRVHVGRGKVVITNDHGSLEVPEGRNAVVTLGSAPEFTDQGPDYQATGPTGDRLIARSMPDQHPTLLDPTADMPLTGTLSSPDGSPAGPGEPPVGPVEPPVDLTDLFAGVWPMDGTFVDPLATAIDTVSADWTLDSSGSAGDLSWGEYINNDPSANRYLPFVAGASPVNFIPSGKLSFELDGATPVRFSDGQDVGSLSLFDFGINLGATELTYDLNFKLSFSDSGELSAQAEDKSLNPGSNAQRFAFEVDGIQSTNGNYSCSPTCTGNFEGFLAGPSGNQAGIVYDIGVNSGDGSLSGAAALKEKP